MITLGSRNPNTILPALEMIDKYVAQLNKKKKHDALFKQAYNTISSANSTDEFMTKYNQALGLVAESDLDPEVKTRMVKDIQTFGLSRAEEIKRKESKEQNETMVNVLLEQYGNQDVIVNGEVKRISELIDNEEFENLTPEKRIVYLQSLTRLPKPQYSQTAFGNTYSESVIDPTTKKVLEQKNYEILKKDGKYYADVNADKLVDGNDFELNNSLIMKGKTAQLSYLNLLKQGKEKPKIQNVTLKDGSVTIAKFIGDKVYDLQGNDITGNVKLVGAIKPKSIKPSKGINPFESLYKNPVDNTYFVLSQLSETSSLIAEKIKEKTGVDISIFKDPEVEESEKKGAMLSLFSGYSLVSNSVALTDLYNEVFEKEFIPSLQGNDNEKKSNALQTLLQINQLYKALNGYDMPQYVKLVERLRKFNLNKEQTKQNSTDKQNKTQFIKPKTFSNVTSSGTSKTSTDTLSGPFEYKPKQELNEKQKRFVNILDKNAIPDSSHIDSLYNAQIDFGNVSDSTDIYEFDDTRN